MSRPIPPWQPHNTRPLCLDLPMHTYEKLLQRATAEWGYDPKILAIAILDLVLDDKRAISTMQKQDGVMVPTELYNRLLKLIKEFVPHEGPSDWIWELEQNEIGREGN